MRYEEIPDYINVYNSEAQLDEYSEIDINFSNFNTGLYIDTEKEVIDDSKYDIETNVYRVDHDIETERDIVLLNIMFDLFLISLLWHSKVKDEEEN